MTGDVPPTRRPPWWEPGRFAAKLPRLEARTAIAGAVRRFFAADGFAEVETPALQVSPGLEPHLIAFATELREPFDDGSGMRLYLHTSPELGVAGKCSARRSITRAPRLPESPPRRPGS